MCMCAYNNVSHINNVKQTHTCISKKTLEAAAKRKTATKTFTFPSKVTQFAI